MKKQALKYACILLSIVVLSGCTFIFQKGRRSDLEKIDALSRQLDDLHNAKRLLESRLSQELRDKQVKVEMRDKGLVITFVADVLFDSGKAKIRQEAYPILDKVATVLRENVPNLNVGIEGHTDNDPIKHSGWKSNWELSTARALSVLYYISEEKNISPQRLSVMGYGEYKPVASNDTIEGKSLNRRVEVVVLPPVKKIKDSREIADPYAGQNLK